MGDTARLHQVVSNLLTNAVKFTPADGWIEVRLERAGPMARIGVEDNGQGIDGGFLPHVFERFRQADGSTTRAYGGLGLGLAIVRHLVDLHGGSVRADSPGLGRGATFTVEIPLLRESGLAFGAGGLSGVADARPDGRPLGGVRVLIVDDEADSRDFVRHLLERAGAVVRVAHSAAEALEIVDAAAPDVLVSDLGMPHQDGYALLRGLRARGGRAASVPALALTAYARPEDRARAIAEGFQAHVSKPIVPEDLIAAIERLVGPGRS